MYFCFVSTCRTSRNPQRTISHHELALEPYPGFRSAKCGKAVISHSQWPGVQTQPLDVRSQCPATQILVAEGRTCQCPGIHTQRLSVCVQYPWTQTYCAPG